MSKNHKISFLDCRDFMIEYIESLFKNCIDIYL